LIANDEFWEQSKELGICQSMDNAQGASLIFAPHPRLWQPDPMIADTPLASSREISSSAR
jgi:hypothetical protein